MNGAFNCLLYAHDGVGIGHAVRACTIAAAIKSTFPDASVGVLTGSPVASDYLPDGVRLLPLPTLPRANSRSEQQPSDAERRRVAQVRRECLLTYVRTSDPDVLLIDHLPLGIYDELDCAVEYLHASGKAILLGYRRIAEDRSSTNRIFTYSPFRTALLHCFSAILVYAPDWIEKDLGPLTDLSLPQPHVGFVCRRSHVAQTRARERFGVPQNSRALAACLGGGRDSLNVARVLFDSWLRARRDGDHLLFFAGPHLLGFDDALSEYENDSDVTIVRHSPTFPAGIAAADAVISTGGYNSLLETICRRKPLWALPNQQGECEQLNSINYLAQRGLLRSIENGADLQAAIGRAFMEIAVTLRCEPSVATVNDAWFDGDVNVARLVRQHAMSARGHAGRIDVDEVSIAPHGTTRLA